MDTQLLTVGRRIDHAQLGWGTITFVGADYLGIAFDASGEALIRRDMLEQEAPLAAEAQAPRRASLPWPESTFNFEAEGARHFPGSHWDPFVEESSGKSSRAEPNDWPKGFQLVWPLREKGLALVLRVESEANMVVSIFPFFAGGSQHTLTLSEVTVWESGVEAQITAIWGDGEVSFFDSQYSINRAWYETGRDYEFIFSGMAYNAGPAEKREWTIDQHPDQVAWMNRQIKDGEEPEPATRTLSLDGAAVLLPVGGWDIDDYSFHAPVKSVQEFEDWLGQDGWRVRATVMRCGGGDCDLDIFITRRAWTGEAPPEVGQDIEGRLWLQGYLWMPGK